MTFTSLDLFNVINIKDINRSFLRLNRRFQSLKKDPNSKGEHHEIMKFLSENKVKVENFEMDLPLNKFPILIEYKGDIIPVLVERDSRDLNEKIERFTGAKIENSVFQFNSIKPWGLIKVQDKRSSSTTDIEHIKKVYIPVLSSLSENVIFNLINEFVVGGKANFRCLINPGAQQVNLKFRGHDDIIIKVGKNIHRQDLTFNRLCCLLGEINRSKIVAANQRLPGLAKNLIIDTGIPKILLFYLHHGVYFSWCFNEMDENDTHHNRFIYMAVKVLDLIFLNHKRMQNKETPFETVGKLLKANPDGQTWTHDFGNFVGINRLLDFEQQNAEFINEWSPLLRYRNIT